ncbi:hypothetical protein MJO29_009956, partial [Puccinia striiformis f. sp. tritici]
MKYLNAVLECLGEFKTVGMDTLHKLFCCAIISEVNRVKRALMETIMWHNRLGHASTDQIKLVIPAGENLAKDKMCDTCMQGKLTRKKFNSHFDQTTAPLEVVHGDL